MDSWLRVVGILAALMAAYTSTWAVCDTELETAISASTVEKPALSQSEEQFRYQHAYRLKNSYSAATVDQIIKAIKNNEEGIARGQIVADNFGPAKAKAHVAYHRWDMCLNKWWLNSIQNRSNNSSIGATFSQSQNNSQIGDQPQQNQSPQQLTAQAQQRTTQNQARADQARQGKRRRHEPENEASQCIQPDFGGLYGGMKNTCDFKVWYTYCGYRPKENSWLTGMNCEKQSFGSDSVGPGRTSAAHTKGVEMLHWIACKEPAWTVDTEFVPGQGIRGRCHTVGGN